jgi:hypothetical protein
MPMEKSWMIRRNVKRQSGIFSQRFKLYPNRDL